MSSSSRFLARCDSGVICQWRFDRTFWVEWHTLHFGQVQTEVVALFQYTLATPVNEVVKSCGELSHAFAEVVETEVYVWKSVEH